MSDDDSRTEPLTPARLRAMAEWFREFAAMGSVEQRLWQLDLAATYERMAVERESRLNFPAGPAAAVAAFNEAIERTPRG